MQIQKEHTAAHNQFHGKKLGIWGFGVGGQSAARFFAQLGCQISVMDVQDAVQEKVAQFSIKGIHFYFDFQKEVFLQESDFVFVSSGVDIQMHYPTWRSKCIFELDIFAKFWKKPIVAITGTLGKTSVTTFLAQILTNAGKRVALGGNIGVGCLDLLEAQETCDLAVLELSSFQLQYCQKFCPSIGIFTNFFPNHLDRHTSEAEYFDAKYSMFVRDDQTHAVMPLNLYDRIRQKGNTPVKRTVFFTDKQPDFFDIARLVYIKHNALWLYQNNVHTHLIELAELPAITFATNWAILAAALLHLGIDPINMDALCNDLAPIEHRMELVAEINGITFYNDSKSTTVQATHAAVEKLQGKPIHLFLGGLSKGVDRSVLLERIQGKVAFIYCFGTEAEQLFAFCCAHNVSAYTFDSLESAFAFCTTKVKSGDQVLFSPAGSSYDLFKNYEERGKCFKNLVINYQNFCIQK